MGFRTVLRLISLNDLEWQFEVTQTIPKPLFRKRCSK